MIILRVRLIINACVARPLKAGAVCGCRRRPRGSRFGSAPCVLGAMAAEDFQPFSVWVGSLRAGVLENSVADYFFCHDLSVEDVRVTANGVLDWYAHVTFLSQEERWGDN